MANKTLEQKKWFKIFRQVYFILAAIAVIWFFSIHAKDINDNQKVDSFLRSEVKSILSDYVIRCDNGKNINAGAAGLPSKTTTDLTYDEDMKARKLCRGDNASLDFILTQRSNGVDDNTLLQNLTKKFYSKEKPMYEHIREKGEDPFALVNMMIDEAIQGIEAPANGNYVLKKDLLFKYKYSIKKWLKKWGDAILGTLVVGGVLIGIYYLVKAVSRDEDNEKEDIDKLTEQADDTVDLFSSRRKGERERMVCAAFLRCLGVKFSPEEIVLSDQDPPDVVFRDARFEVMIILDDNRKMHTEWKAKAIKRHAARRFEDLCESHPQSSPMEPEEVADKLVAELAKKASHYGLKTCLKLDALVYINLLKGHLYPISQIKAPKELRSQGWRSVSIIFSQRSQVVFTTSEAPDLLCGYEGYIKQECGNPDKMFEL